MSDDVVVKGLSDLKRALDTLPDKIEANVMRSALAAGARVIKNLAREMVPVRTGKLRKSIRTSGLRGIAMVKAGKRGKGIYDQGWYAHIVHEGASPHRIVARGFGRRLFFGGRYVSGVDHPGARANPFLENALALGADSAVRVVAQKIAARLRDEHGFNTADPETFDE